MGTSERSFEQVKSILGKLDRNIDAARARRLDVPAHTPPMRQAVPASSNMIATQTVGKSHAPAMAPAAAVPATPPQPLPSKSGFGRAQPLRRPSADNA